MTRCAAKGYSTASAPVLKNAWERRGRLVFLTTVSDANVERMAELPELLAPLGPDEIILQQLMYLTGEEIAAYRNYSRTHFGCDYPELEAWRRDDDAAYLARLKEQTALVRQRRHPVKVTVTGHRYPSLSADTPPCQAPGCRLHIRHDGEVGFCTDYFGFSIGKRAAASAAGADRGGTRRTVAQSHTG